MEYGIYNPNTERFLSNDNDGSLMRFKDKTSCESLAAEYSEHAGGTVNFICKELASKSVNIDNNINKSYSIYASIRNIVGREIATIELDTCIGSDRAENLVEQYGKSVSTNPTIHVVLTGIKMAYGMSFWDVQDMLVVVMKKAID